MTEQAAAAKRFRRVLRDLGFADGSPIGEITDEVMLAFLRSERKRLASALGRDKHMPVRLGPDGSGSNQD